MEINLEGISQARQQIGMATSEIKRGYDGAWDDAVHDSFAAFVDAFETQTKKVEGIVENLEKIKETLKQVDIDKLSSPLKNRGK